MLDLLIAAAIVLPKGVPVIDYHVTAAKPSMELETPVQYQGPASAYTIWVHQKDVVTWCGPASPGLVKMGCMMENKTLLLSNPCDEKVWPDVKDKRSYAHYVCHEKAHVNGWLHR